MAIDDLLDEHEQSERVRTWLRDNAGGLIGGVVICLALIGGWQWWQRHAREQSLQAAARYQAVQQALGANDLAKAKAALGSIADTPYATYAALNLAKAQSDAGQKDAAIATLRGIDASDEVTRGVVRERLARLLLDSGNAKQAVDLLASDTGIASLEARGDAELALGRPDAARTSYLKAWTQADAESPERALLELKLSKVGGVPAKPEAKT